MSKKSLMGSSASLPDTTSWSEPKETVLHLGDNVLGVIKPGPPTGPMDTGISTACIDCRTETQPNKAAGNYEQFIVTDEVWQAAGMPLGNVDPKSFVLKEPPWAAADKPRLRPSRADVDEPRRRLAHDSTHRQAQHRDEGPATNPRTAHGSHAQGQADATGERGRDQRRRRTHSPAQTGTRALCYAFHDGPGGPGRH